MNHIKYNNVATVRMRSKRKAERFVAIVARQPLAQGCKVLHGEYDVSLLVPQDVAKQVQLDRMTSFRNAAKFYQASERAKLSERIQGTKRKRQALKDVLESFAPLSASDDSEARHHAADLLLCTALEALGQKAIVEAWRKVGKRYA